MFEPGIAFDVRPIEPGESSFAMNTTPWRGQSPSGAPDDWTQRFTYEVHRTANQTVFDERNWDEMFSVGSFNEDIESILEQEEIDAIEAAEQTGSEVADDAVSEPFEGEDSSGNHQSSVEPGSQARQDAIGARNQLMARRETLQEARRSNFQPAVASTVEPRSTIANKPGRATPASSGMMVADQSMSGPGRVRQGLGGHSFGANSEVVASTSETLVAPSSESALASIATTSDTFFRTESVVASEALEFRTVDPVAFFSAESATFVASEQMIAAEEPVIRAQSPDAATPRMMDPLVEGSPYRNQYREIPPGWVDIDVNATEGRTGRLMFGAGVNSNAGVVGSFVWDESNFDIYRPPTSFADIIEGRAWRGGGQRFRLEAAPGDQVSRYQVSWTDPYFLYTDFSLSVSGFYFNRYYPDWTEDRWGGRIATGYQFTPEWSGNVALRLEEVVMRDVENPHPAIVDPIIGSSFLSTVRVSGTHDTRDSAMMPSEGHYFDAGYEQAFADFNFPKIDTEFRQYFTLFNRPDGTGRQVLTMAGSLGWSGDDTPVFERYYAGGFQSFRGFSFRGVTPRAGNFATGGTFQALGTVEYRVPVTADDMINVVAFTDFGTVDDELTLARFRASAGFGVRLVIPAMGPVPLAFDFAFPIVKEQFDDEQIFSFYVGINR